MPSRDSRQKSSSDITFITPASPAMNNAQLIERLEGEPLKRLNEVSDLPDRYPESFEKNMHEWRENTVNMPSLTWPTGVGDGTRHSTIDQNNRLEVLSNASSVIGKPGAYGDDRGHYADHHWRRPGIDTS